MDRVAGTMVPPCRNPPRSETVSAHGASFLAGSILETLDAKDCMDGVMRAPALRILSLIIFCCCCISFHLSSSIRLFVAEAILKRQIMTEITMRSNAMTNVDQVNPLVFSKSMSWRGLVGALVIMALMAETTPDLSRTLILDVIRVALGPLPVVTRLPGASRRGTAKMLEGKMI